MSLKILMADDHKKQIEDARDALRKLGHDVRDVYKYDEAEKLAQEDVFDIAVIDLGWYDDKYLISKGVARSRRAEMGFALVDLVENINRDAIRIIYSVHTDDVKVIQGATARGAICVKKIREDDPDAKHSHEYLAYVVATIALILSDKKKLQMRVGELEDQLAELQKEKEKLEQKTNNNEQEKQKFRRILGTATIIPTIAFMLSILAWYYTKQQVVSVFGFLGGGFFTIVILRATGFISHADLKSLGEILTTLFRINSK